jgi:hypothetical protein
MVHDTPARQKARKLKEEAHKIAREAQILECMEKAWRVKRRLGRRWPRMPLC